MSDKKPRKPKKPQTVAVEQGDVSLSFPVDKPKGEVLKALDLIARKVKAGGA